MSYINPMTEEEWNKKWPMSKIPDYIREVVVAWTGHLFIKDKVKFAQDLLEATEKHRLEYAKIRCIGFAEYCAKYGWWYDVEKGFWYDNETSIERTHDQMYELYLKSLEV